MTFDETKHARVGGAGKNRTQFAEMRRTTGDITLTPDRAPIRATVTINWTEQNVLPTPRHRKPVDVERDHEATFEVQHVTADDAPIGYVAPDTVSALNSDGAYEFIDVGVEYRMFSGQLYRRQHENDEVTPVRGDSLWLDQLVTGTNRYSHETSPRAAEQYVQDRLNEHLVIDGEVWMSAPEPCYEVETSFGYGSARLRVTSAPKTAENAAPDRFFPADQREAAIAYALNIRGDTAGSELEAALRGSPEITVAPEANPGTTTWTPAPQLRYTPLYRWRADEDFEGDLADFRQQMLQVPGLVTRVDDGFGGTSVHIDETKLSATQASDYREYVKEVGRRRRARKGDA